jgi:hypothetical protein
MANPEHLQILEQGVETWNARREQTPYIYMDGTYPPGIRPDLSKANLSGANLSGADLDAANLSEANLSGADLRKAHLFDVNLSGANLSGANLSEANLSLVNLSGANLSEANLIEANLFGANLTGANLTGANLTLARLSEADLTGANLSHVLFLDTIFGNTDLTAVQGLETCIHDGPSILDPRVLARSGPLPLAFLRGCGWPETFIENLPSLLGEPIQYDSLFISYASHDQAFAEHLHADLQNKGVRCWYAPEDMKIGDEFRSRIDASIHLHDCLLLILSEHSIKSQWVQKEVETAFEKEKKTTVSSCFPSDWMTPSCRLT